MPKFVYLYWLQVIKHSTILTLMPSHKKSLHVAGSILKSMLPLSSSSFELRCEVQMFILRFPAEFGLAKVLRLRFVVLKTTLVT